MSKSEIVRCDDCSHIMRVGDYPFCPHESICQRDAQATVPTVYFKAADGTLRFPGRADAKTPKGYERIEVRTPRERDHLYREMDSADRRRYEAHQERLASTYGAIENRDRSELRAEMERMSDKGRAVAQAAMDYYDKRDGYKPYSGGNYVESWEYDSSNREGHNDTDTGWRKRK